VMWAPIVRTTNGDSFKVWLVVVGPPTPYLSWRGRFSLIFALSTCTRQHSCIHYLHSCRIFLFHSSSSHYTQKKLLDIVFGTIYDARLEMGFKEDFFIGPVLKALS